MKKKLFLLFSGIAMIFLLSACGNKVNGSQVEVGLNEITLKQLEQMLDNDETIVFMTFSANEEDVKKSKLIEAYDASLKRANLKAFYVNLIKESDETIRELGEKYTHVKMTKLWTPDEDGLMRAENGRVIGSITNLKREYIVRVAEKADEEGLDYLSKNNLRNIDEIVVNILEKIDENNLELTY